MRRPVLASVISPGKCPSACSRVSSRSFHGTRCVSTSRSAPARAACSAACWAVRCRSIGLLGRLQERRLEQRDIGVAREVHEAVGGPGVPGIGQNAATSLDADAVCLHRMDHPGGADREGTDRELRFHVPDLELPGHGLIPAQPVGSNQSTPGIGRAPHGDGPHAAGGPIAQGDVVGAQVDEVIDVQVADEHRVDVVDVDEAGQRAERAIAHVQQDPGALMLQQVARGGRIRARETIRNSQRRRVPHSERRPANARATTTAARRVTTATAAGADDQLATPRAGSTVTISGPRKRRPSAANESGSPVARK